MKIWAQRVAERRHAALGKLNDELALRREVYLGALRANEQKLAELVAAPTVDAAAVVKLTRACGVLRSLLDGAPLPLTPGTPIVNDVGEVSYAPKAN